MQASHPCPDSENWKAHCSLDRQTALLARLQHEMRNPLSALRSVAAVLTLTTGSFEELQRASRIIDRQVVQISQVFDDLVRALLSHDDTLHMAQQDVDLGQSIRESIATVQPQIDVRRQTLSVSLWKAAAPVTADPVRITQVFVNILANASKYTKLGGNICIRVAEEDRGFEVTISDDGIGIQPDMLLAIFDPFVRLREAVAHDNQGMGIGLAVVAEIICAHGGTIKASSAGCGLGSDFIVWLPRK